MNFKQFNQFFITMIIQKSKLKSNSIFSLPIVMKLNKRMKYLLFIQCYRIKIIRIIMYKPTKRGLCYKRIFSATLIFEKRDIRWNPTRCSDCIVNSPTKDHPNETSLYLSITDGMWPRAVYSPDGTRWGRFI